MLKYLVLLVVLIGKTKMIQSETFKAPRRLGFNDSKPNSEIVIPSVPKFIPAVAVLSLDHVHFSNLSRFIMKEWCSDSICV